ncbi:MAG TPA: hypothetical protein VHD83_13425 [Puia sp.]|nr:hypothetical protein [Puia sp.]
MKKIIIILVFIAGTHPIVCRAQSTSDLIEQLVLDLQKLQDMKATLQDMYDGYKILDEGYTRIKDIAQGQFNLHKAFLDGLLAVSPIVRNYYRVGEIIRAEYNLVREYKASSGSAHGSGVFTNAELEYIDGIYSTLFNHSLQSIDELTMILTDDALRMSDAQRIAAIDRVYGEVAGQLRTVRQLNSETSVQIVQREKELNTIQTLKRLYDNP